MLILATCYSEDRWRWTEYMRARAHERESVCVHTAAKTTSGSEQLRHVHTCVYEATYKIPYVAFPVLGDTDGYHDVENESDHRNGMTWGRYTRKENGESSLKRNINK